MFLLARYWMSSWRKEDDAYDVYAFWFIDVSGRARKIIHLAQFFLIILGGGPAHQYLSTTRGSIAYFFRKCL